SPRAPRAAGATDRTRVADGRRRRPPWPDAGSGRAASLLDGAPLGARGEPRWRADARVPQPAWVRGLPSMRDLWGRDRLPALQRDALAPPRGARTRVPPLPAHPAAAGGVSGVRRDRAARIRGRDGADRSDAACLLSARRRRPAGPGCRAAA